MVNFYDQIKNIALKFKTNDIFIIGKGSSIDDIDLDVITNSLIINLNDSEKILQGDICIFHKDWVLDSLSRKGLDCKLYVTDSNKKSKSNANFYIADFFPYTQENKELIMHRYIKDEMTIEEILFVSALKICQIISTQKRETQKVYMIGFDFNLDQNIYSQKINFDHSLDDINFKTSFIMNQEFYLIQIMSLIDAKKDQDIDLMHVGNKPYSKLSCNQFNQLFRHSSIAGNSGIKVSGIKKDKNFKKETNKEKGNSLIVAEFTNNHLGNIERLLKMVRLAKESGADLIKVQKRNVNNFYTKTELNSYYKSPFGETLGAYRQGVELTKEGLKELDNECQRCGMDWFSTILDYDSFLILKEFKNKLIKIPSTVSEHTDFIKMVAENYKGTIVISTGYTMTDYEEFILRTFKNNNKIYLLHTVSAYPTPFYDCNIAVLRHYSNISRQYANVFPGYSSHDMGSLGSMLAIASGAKMIEKHVKLGVTEWIHYDDVALDLENGDFKNFVEDIRLAEKMCGEEIKKLSISENHKYWLSK